MRPDRLSAEEIERRLVALAGWELRDGKLHRELELASFVQVFSLMTAMALVSERMDHHPEWSNVYNRLVIDLSTHDADGITSLDFDWAQALNEHLGR